MLRTPLCDVLGIDVPIILAAMGGSASSAEFAAAADGYTAIRHQREVGTAYFDEVSQVISEGESSTTALHGSTESEQFH